MKDFEKYFSKKFTPLDRVTSGKPAAKNIMGLLLDFPFVLKYIHRVMINELLTAEYDFEFPVALTARYPRKKRDLARMMVINRETHTIEHRLVHDLPDYFSNTDLMVLNDTKVFPARIYGHRAKTGGRVEILLVRHITKHKLPSGIKPELNCSYWTAMINMNRKVTENLAINLPGEIRVRVIKKGIEMTPTPLHLIELSIPDNEILPTLDQIGRTPLPPYLKRKDIPADRDTYQTIYAKEYGSVAAPTAGLHFTEDLLGRIKARGTEIVTITLHVGPATFIPVEAEHINDHPMHSEEYVIPEKTCQKINQQISGGHPITATGTTSVRTIETLLKTGELCGVSDLFIYPGYHFQGVGKMLTNFHRPVSTLFMLVCAFAGTTFMKECYQIAFREKYRLFSYGDAMLII